jgi:hypothetical protein
VSPRHQNARKRKKSAIFGPKLQFDPKNDRQGCRRDTLMTDFIGNIPRKAGHARPNRQNDRFLHLEAKNGK